MKDMKKPKAKVKAESHKDAAQDKALFGKMMKKEMPKMAKKGYK
jgi:hypothetical protein